MPQYPSTVQIVQADLIIFILRDEIHIQTPKMQEKRRSSLANTSYDATDGSKAACPLNIVFSYKLLRLIELPVIGTLLVLE
jgi:hypothetical protein